MQPDKSQQVSDRTVKRYASWIATQPNIGLRKKVHHQTALRDNAVGRSERNSLAHAGSILAACAVPDPTGDGPRVTHEVDKFIFYPHMWVKPRYIFNTDDSDFRVAMNKKGGVQYYWVRKDEADAYRSFHTVGWDPMANVQTIKWKATLQGTGVLPYIMLICKISAREMPPAVRGKPPPLAVPVWIPGLCLGGNASGAKTPGVIMYVQKLSHRDEAGQHSLTEQIERWHDEHLFLPLVKRLRQEDGWTPGSLVPPHLVRLRSIDGGTAALKAILRARSQGDVDIKHGSQTSSACQAFDVGPCARSSKSLTRGGTSNDIVESGASRSLKHIIERETKRAGVNLTTRRKNCLFPFISKFPDITAAACSPKNILSGFYENGTIDPKTNKPNIDKLLRTCNRTWTTDRWSHCTKVLRTDVVPLFHLNGEVSEAQWDDMKVNLDTDKSGKIIKRKFTVALQ